MSDWLEGMKRLAALAPYSEPFLKPTAHCRFCGAHMWRPDDVHDAGCPVLSLPRLIAIAAVAERVVASDKHLVQDLACDPWVCTYCNYSGGHGEECVLGQLESALRVAVRGE